MLSGPSPSLTASPSPGGTPSSSPRRQISTWWDATDQERADLISLVDDVRRLLDERHRPDGYNVGFNAGAAVGQTVDHLHIHIIPRYAGDVSGPRGGVRHVLPHRANSVAPWLVDDMLREQLVRCLRDPRFDRVDLVVSFIMTSGVDLISGALPDALARGARVRVLTTAMTSASPTRTPSPGSSTAWTSPSTGSTSGSSTTS